MARTSLTPVALSAQSVTVSADAADITFTAGDDVNGNDWTPAEGDLLIVNNTDVGAQTVTIDAAADGSGRDGTITAYSLAAGELAIFGPFKLSVWRQTDGMIHVDVSDSAVELAVFHIR